MEKCYPDDPEGINAAHSQDGISQGIPHKERIERKPVDRQKFAVGSALIIQGLAQCYIGYNDPDHGLHGVHEDGHEYYDAHEDHEYYDAHDHVHEHYTASFNTTTGFTHGMSSGHEHDVYEDILRTIRRSGHGVEGALNILAGVCMVLESLHLHQAISKPLKLAANLLQFLSLTGTAMAATSDWLHGHVSHAVCHTSQAFCTLAMTIPSIAHRCGGRCTLEKSTRNRWNIAGNFLDFIPSVILCTLTTSVGYGVEAICNLFMGIFNWCFPDSLGVEVKSSDDLSTIEVKSEGDELVTVTASTERLRSGNDPEADSLLDGKIHVDVTNSAQV